jgi:hypothetical protein
MKTNVIMKRELFSEEIGQRSDNDFFSATDLVRAGNAWRVANKMQPFNMNDWFNQKSTKDFIQELEKQFGVVKISGRGRGHYTWVHPFLFIDMALAISPKLKIETYQWLYDKLIEYRNLSGDSYKKLAGALKAIETNQSKLTEHIKEAANKIKLACDVKDWQTATEAQLKMRDKIHDYVWVMSDIIKDRETLLNVAIKKAKENK